ncbi:MAG: Glycerate dehydrogenase [Desulfovibrio sp.]
MKIVISDCDHASIDQEIQVVTGAGLPEPAWFACHTEDDVIRQCKGAAVILNQYAPITRKVLAALAPELKQVVRYGVGVNNVDLAAATEFGVQVCNVPDYGMHEVSDHTLALMLALARKIVLMNTAVTNGAWDYQKSIPIFRLCEQTVGTIGMGRNGRLFMKKAAALGCRCIGYDAYYKPAPADTAPANNARSDTGIEQVSLETLLTTADFVVVNCPLTDETRNMLGAAAFAKMKKTAYVINAARGGIIDESALAAALQTGEIAGAALDVTETEPLAANSPLRAHENCILTPHMAWYSEEAALELKRKAAEEAVRMATGQSVHYPVNTLA